MALTYNQITAIAQNLIDKKLTDNVFSATPALARFKAKAAKVSGGPQIQVPLINSSSTSGAWYSGEDALTTSSTSNMTAAVFDWKQLHESVKISRLDLAKTSGDAGKLDLVKSKVQIAEMALAERLGSGLFADGTGSGGKELTGLQATLSTSSTYGGIAVADMATWVAVVHDNAGVDRALSLALIQALDGACTNGKDTPTIFFSKQDVYDEAYNLFTAFQRIESEDIGKLGFKSLMINGKPLVVDSHMKANSIFAINENYAQLRVHADNDMRKEHHQALESSDCMLTKIFWFGNLTCSQRRSHGELADIQVA